MKAIKILFLLAILTVAFSGISFADDQPGGGIVISTSGDGSSGVITGGGTIIQPPPSGLDGGITIGTIPLFNPPVIKSRTVLIRGYKFVYTTETYTWITNNKLGMRISKIQKYNKLGLLVEESGDKYSYDINGKLAFGTPICKYDYSYTYNSNKQCVKEVWVDSFYDAKNKLAYTERYDISHTYNSDGSLKEDKYVFKRTDPKGKLLETYSTIKTYGYYDGGSKSVTTSAYDGNNKLTSECADLTIVKNGSSSTYYVVYDVDSTGNITNTHVYDGSTNTEITAIGGSGIKNVADIVNSIQNPPAPETNLVVTGDITFNQNNTWDFSKYNLSVSGTMTVGPAVNGYDIYVNGDITIDSKGTVDLSPYSIYVNGTMTITAGTLVLGSEPFYADAVIIEGGSLCSGGGLNIDPTNSGTLTLSGTGSSIFTTTTLDTGTLTISGSSSTYINTGGTLDGMTTGTINTAGDNETGTLTITGQQGPTIILDPLPVNGGSINIPVGGTVTTTTGSSVPATQGDLTVIDKISTIQSAATELPAGVSITGTMVTKEDNSIVKGPKS